MSSITLYGINPCAYIGFGYYMKASQQAIQEFEQIHQYALTQLVDSINRQFNEFNTIAGLVANDNNLTPFATAVPITARYKVLKGSGCIFPG